MFTGVIEDIGEVVDIRRKGKSLEIGVETSLSDINKGDSIALNGICLTVKGIKGKILYFDVSQETLKSSTLKLLCIKEKVNLERAIKANGRFNGHLVQGHVDCTGIIRAFFSEGDHRTLRIWIPPKFKSLVVYKGSIAIDGVSLTINRIDGTLITINIIPYTYENTTLKFKKPNDRVNIEFDLIGKYVLGLRNI